MIRKHGLVLVLTPFLVVLAGACSSSVTDGSIAGEDGGSTDDGSPSTGSDGGTRKDGAAGDASTSDGPITMTDGAVTDGASSDGTSLDGMTTDGSSSDAATTDASDAGPLVCGPGSISGFSPQWWPPSTFHQNLCTTAQTGALVDCLSDIPDKMTCDAFRADPANAACIACAITQSTASISGPLVADAVLISVNTAGCVARATNDVTSTGCGAKRQAADQCEAFSCGPSCPALDQQGFDDYLQCISDADTSTCMTYADAAACVTPDLELDGSAPQCALTGADFSANANIFVDLFCGAP